MTFQTIRYSRSKLLGMALLCGLVLPVLSPLMLATGPAAVILIPLLLIGGPVIAVYCLIRAFGSGIAFEHTPAELTVRSLWRTARILPEDLVDIRVDEVVTRYLFIPINTKTYLVVDYRGALGKRRKRIDLKLVEQTREEVERIAGAVRAMAGSHNLSGAPRPGLMQPAR